MLAVAIFGSQLRCEVCEKTSFWQHSCRECADAPCMCAINCQSCSLHLFKHAVMKQKNDTVHLQLDKHWGKHPS
jgi:hypothetical protein